MDERHHDVDVRGVGGSGEGEEMRHQVLTSKFYLNVSDCELRIELGSADRSRTAGRFAPRRTSRSRAANRATNTPQTLSTPVVTANSTITAARMPSARRAVVGLKTDRAREQRRLGERDREQQRDDRVPLHTYSTRKMTIQMTSTNAQ